MQASPSKALPISMPDHVCRLMMTMEIGRFVGTSNETTGVQTLSELGLVGGRAIQPKDTHETHLRAPFHIRYTAYLGNSQTSPSYMWRHAVDHASLRSGSA